MIREWFTRLRKRRRPSAPLIVALYQNPACGRTNVGVTIVDHRGRQYGIQMAPMDAEALAHALQATARRARSNSTAHGYLVEQEGKRPFAMLSTIIMTPTA